MTDNKDKINKKNSVLQVLGKRKSAGTSRNAQANVNTGQEMQYNNSIGGVSTTHTGSIADLNKFESLSRPFMQPNNYTPAELSNNPLFNLSNSLTIFPPASNPF